MNSTSRCSTSRTHKQQTDPPADPIGEAIYPADPPAGAQAHQQIQEHKNRFHALCLSTNALFFQK